MTGATTATTVQAKNRTKPITLGQASVRDLISHGFLRGEGVRTIVWTRAVPGNEKGLPLDEPGILHWQKVATGKAPPERLRDFLLAKKRLSTEAVKVLAACKPRKLPGLFAKIEWMTGELGIDELRARVTAKVKARMQHLRIENPSVTREHFASALFAKVAEVGAKEERTQRTLRRPELDRVLLALNADGINANLPSLQNAFSGAVNDLASAVVDKIAQNGLSISAQRPDGAQLSATGFNDAMAQALERDLTARYRRAQQRSMFAEERETNEFVSLGTEAMGRTYAPFPPRYVRPFFCMHRVTPPYEDCVGPRRSFSRLHSRSSDRLPTSSLARAWRQLAAMSILPCGSCVTQLMPMRAQRW